MSQSRTLTSQQIARAALVVLLGFLASGLLGLVRTSVIASAFGTSNQLDAFFAAQRLPEMLFNLVAGGALGSAFIPVFSRFLNDDDDPTHQQAWQLASATMTLSASAAGILAVLFGVLAPWLVPLFLAPDSVGADVQQLTIRLMQLMLITPVVFSISGLLMGILNAHQLFTLPALAISMNNIGLIVGALFFSRWLSPDGTPNIYGLAYGAVLGAVLHLFVQLPGLRGLGAKLRFLPRFSVQGVREVLLLMGPRVLGLAVVQINFIVNVRLSLPMLEGSTAALTTAFALMFFALGIIAQSIGTALFPTLSALAAQNDIDGFRERLTSAMRSVLFLSLPAMVGLILLGEPLITMIAERGAWTAESTQATAWALSFFALGIAGHSLLEVLSRAFYALSDTWTPVWVGLLAMIANILLSLWFIRFMGDPNSLARGPFAGLALANSVTTLLESAVLWWLMRRRIHGLNDGHILKLVFQTTLASAVMGLALWYSQTLTTTWTAYVTVPVVGGVAVLIFFTVAALLKVNEATTVPRLILSKLKK